MTTIRVALVDVVVARTVAGSLECLVLRRSAVERSAGSWECVHGAIEPGETPVEAARREVREETGFAEGRWFNLSRVEAFYRHQQDELALIPVFVVFVDATARPVLSEEHDDCTWLPLGLAADRVSWPRVARTLGDVGVLFPAGEDSPVDDVLRIDPA